MDSVLVDSPFELSSLAFGPLAHLDLSSMLKESADRFIVQLRNDSCDFSSFKSVAFRVLQSTIDPPLEVVSFYSAVCFRESVRSSRDVSQRASAVRDLLQLISACSAASSGPKSIALVAPAVCELYQCLKEEAKLSGKSKTKARREIEGLLEGVVSYISICSGRGFNGQGSGNGCLLPCFADVMRVWTVEYGAVGDGFDVLFPLVSDEIRNGLREDGCAIDYLASVVVAEAFLLVLSLKVEGGGAPRADLQKELRIWAVSSITAFANGIFYEMLLKLLLNQPLPVISLVRAEDENLVRDILYDVVILIDYSFVNPDETPANVLFRRLMVSYQAIQVAREKEDQGKAMSYTNAFSTSCVPNGLIRFVGFLVGLKTIDRPNAATPQAFLKWLIGLEEQGLRVFEDEALKRQSKLLLAESKFDAKSTGFSGKKIADSDLFFFDKGGNVPESATMQDEDMERIDAAFKSAAHSMKPMETNGRRKRKEWLTDADVDQKSVKYKVHDSSAKHFLRASTADSMSSGSEVENPSSDHEMDITEQ